MNDDTQLRWQIHEMATLDNMSFEDIAEALDLTVEYVEQVVHSYHHKRP